MRRKKAALILDPNRRREQMAYISERAGILHEVGGQLWVEITETQASLFSERGILVQLHEEADLIELPALTFDPADGAPEPPDGLRAAAPPRGERARYLVQFGAPADPAWINEVIALGGIYVQNLPVNVGLFQLTAHQAAAVDALEYVTWVGIYHPAYTLSYLLAGRDEPFTAGTLWELAVDSEGLPADGDEGNVLVRLFEDVSPDDAREALAGAGAVIRGGAGRGFVVSADATAVSRLLRVAGVLAVEGYVGVSLANDRGGVIMGVEQVRSFGNVNYLVNLDGAGEIAGVIDSGLDTGALPGLHADLGNRVLQLNHFTIPGTAVPDAAPHGTHVTGSIAGDGTGSGGQIRGIAPASHVIFHGPLAGHALNDFLQGWRNAHRDGARVHNNSWGTSDAVTNNAYFKTITDEVDRFCFSHPDSLVVFAAHNHETDAQPAPVGNGVLDMNRMSLFATAKNVLTVGALESVRNGNGFPDSYRQFYNALVGAPRYGNAAFNALAGGAAGAFTMSDNADQLALFSCRGRVQASGGRVKPDLVAPGTNIVSLRSSQTPPPTPPPPPPPAVGVYTGWMDPAATVAHPNLPNLYMVMHGTSMATPLVSGAAILARQYYRTRFGQLRRPHLLGQVSTIVGLPTVASHRDGRVVAWVQRDAVSGQNHIVAARYSSGWVRHGGIVRLQANVGDHPAPALARHGTNTLLLHRASDNNVRLSLYDTGLAPVTAFGVNGMVTLAPASSSEDSRPPALCVRGDEVAVVWNQSGADSLLFQRFRADNGEAVDAAARSLGNMTHSSSHPFIAHNGTHYAVVWARLEGAERKLRLRMVDDSGEPDGARPRTLASQTRDIRDPHLVWDPRHDRFMVVWAGSEAHPSGDVRYLFLDPDGAPVGAANTATTVPAANVVRRPYVAPHPDAGYVLLWEDNTQGNRHDVYLTFLDNTGQPDRIPQDPTDPPIPAPAARPSRRLLRLSDTPEDTSGITALVDASGVAVVWQSNDEINSDRLGVYALNVTPLGAFQAQADPNTPLVESGRYKNHVLLDRGQTSLANVSMVWAGGAYYLLRKGAGYLFDDLQLLRTNADGWVDAAYGANGVRPLTAGLFLEAYEAHWTGDRLICVTVGRWTGPDIFLSNAAGEPVAGFGSRGTRSIDEKGVVNAEIAPQLGHYTRPGFRVVVAYGTGWPRADKIRYAVLNGSGGFVTRPLDLASANGTARHGWFHFVGREARSIAAWHREVGGSAIVFVNRYTPEGSAQHKPDDLRLTTLAGESMNAVIAPRPVAINTAAGGVIVQTTMGNRREYGAAWQYRADPAQPWEIRFSRLDQDGRVMPNPPVPAPPVVGGTRDVRVIFPNPPDWPANADAIEPQLVSTYTHEPWASPPAGSLPQWSPGYGLAWVGRSSGGGPRTLYFTVLDENGNRAQLPLPPPYAVGAPRSQAAPLVAVSTSGTDVQDFKLIWNGRAFRLTWTEIQGGRLRHMQTALTRQGSRVVYEEPSSALLRATLINGATNIGGTALPNIPTPPITPVNRNHGYGWGRVNLRQSLAPAPPVTFHARDDSAVGPGRRASYRFSLPPETQLLRVTLVWTDPPDTGARIVNNLHLRVIPPGGAAAGREYHGNTWRAAPNAHLSRLVSPATPFDSVHNIEQVVVQSPPGGDYDVEVIAEPFSVNPFNQLNAQPYALVFVGSGPEVRFGGIPAGPMVVY